MRIRLDKIDGFYRVHGGEFRHLVLFHNGLFDKICDKIKYLISEKMVLQIVLIKILERSGLIHIKKILTFHNVIILIKSVVNKASIKIDLIHDAFK